jgi:hypothetical protein
MRIVAPRASWRENLERKTVSLQEKKKAQKTEREKGDILIEVRKGTF